MVEQQNVRGSNGRWCITEHCGLVVPCWTKMWRGRPKCKECGMDVYWEGKSQCQRWHGEMPTSQIEPTTACVICLWSRNYGLWCQGHCYCTGQMMDMWYTLPIQNQPWQQLDVDHQSPLARKRGRPRTLLAWPTTLGRRWRNNGAGQIHGHEHHTDGGTWDRVRAPVELGLLDHSALSQWRRYFSERWTTLSGWRDVHTIPGPSRWATMSKSTERKVGLYQTLNRLEWQNSVQLTTLHPSAWRRGAVECR